MALIEAQDLGRRFDQRTAVAGLSFSLQPGSVLALLGPNGAGKTTTMRMLAGLLAPSEGSATVCGHALGRAERDNDAIRGSCGIVPEAPGFYERLAARDNLRFFGGLQGLAPAVLETRIDAELARFELSARAADRVATYSKGMKQRLSLARALLHRPQVLFLDEPTAGLDPQATQQLHATIRQLRADGCGIVLSTHSMEEAEALADELLVIATRPLYLGAPAALNDAGTDVLLIELAQPLAGDLPCPAGVAAPSLAGSQLAYRVSDYAGQTPAVVAALVDAGAAIVGVRRQQRGLRERYLELVQR